MKYVIIISLAVMTACTSYDADLQAHLEAEQDFHAHQMYLESIYSKYDPEYIDDCYYYNLECGL
jgi:hypothetical protein